MYDPERSNRYTEDWSRMLIWFDRDGALSEHAKRTRMRTWYGNNRYTYISTTRAYQLGYTPRTTSAFK